MNASWTNFIQGISLILIGVGCYVVAYYIRDPAQAPSIATVGTLLIGFAGRHLGSNPQQPEGPAKE